MALVGGGEIQLSLTDFLSLGWYYIPIGARTGIRYLWAWSGKKWVPGFSFIHLDFPLSHRLRNGGCRDALFWLWRLLNLPPCHLGAFFCPISPVLMLPQFERVILIRVTVSQIYIILLSQNLVAFFWPKLDRYHM